MKSDLDLLIELYETEKHSLEQLIKDCIDEFEYQSAYFHSEALSRVNGQLHLLHNFKGPLQDQKELLERMIKTMSKLSEEKLSEFLVPHWEKRIKEQEIKVEELSKQKRPWFNDEQQIDDAIFNLYEEKIKKFRLLLNKEDNFYLDFEITTEQILLIKIDLNNILNSDHIYTEDHLNDHPFRGLGFKLNDEYDKLIYKYNMKGFKEALSIKMLISRVVYDIYGAGCSEPKLIIYGN